MTTKIDGMWRKIEKIDDELVLLWRVDAKMTIGLEVAVNFVV